MKAQAIAQILREYTQSSIANYTKHHCILRQSVYEALDGKGAQHIHVSIASSIISPSVLSHENHKRIKLIDDFDFLELAR